MHFLPSGMDSAGAAPNRNQVASIQNCATQNKQLAGGFIPQAGMGYPENVREHGKSARRPVAVSATEAAPD